MEAPAVRKTYEDFGFGERTGVDLPGESRGVLQKLPWRDHLLANISFGHGVTATPLQIAAAYAAIANGGELKKPLLVKSAINEESGVHEEFKTETIRRVLSPEQASTLRLMLNAATSNSGTGRAAQVAGFPVAGKTGTAQKVIVGQGYAKDQYISSCAGFIPAHNPRFVIYVAIDNPRNKYYGGEVAAPMFSRIASFAVRRAGLSPVLITQKNVRPNSAVGDGERVRSESIQKIRDMAKILSAEEQNITPDFTGLTLREVLNRVRGTPLKVNVRGEGVVSLSVPAPGESLPDDKTVQLYFDPN
jgi:cell division protein FtsI (penicillin-binding protein 3)